MKTEKPFHYTCNPTTNYKWMAWGKFNKLTKPNPVEEPGEVFLCFGASELEAIKSLFSAVKPQNPLREYPPQGLRQVMKIDFHTEEPCFCKNCGHFQYSSDGENGECETGCGGGLRLINKMHETYLNGLKAPF